MHRPPTWAFVPLVLLIAGCGHEAAPASRTATPPQAVTPEPDAEAAATPAAADAPPARPEQRLSRAAAAARAASATAPLSGAQATVPTPETVADAEALMTRLDRDLADRELEPGAAERLRASFRGRLLAAGIPAANIDLWVRGAFVP